MKRVESWFLSRATRPISHCVGRSVRPSVRRSVRPSHFTFHELFEGRIAPVLVSYGCLCPCPNHFCPCPTHYCPCPTARDRGRRVYGLVNREKCYDYDTRKPLAHHSFSLTNRRPQLCFNSFKYWHLWPLSTGQASAGSAGVNYVATTPFPVQLPQGGQLPHIWNHNMVTVFPHGNAMATVSTGISHGGIHQKKNNCFNAVYF